MKVFCALFFKKALFSCLLYRGLGIAVADIVIDGETVDLRVLPDRGWHEIEHDGPKRWRWTDGYGQLPATMGPCRVTVTVAGSLHYRRFALAA